MFLYSFLAIKNDAAVKLFKYRVLLVLDNFLHLNDQMWDCYFKLYDYIYFSDNILCKTPLTTCIINNLSQLRLLQKKCHRLGDFNSRHFFLTIQEPGNVRPDRGVGWLGSGEGVFLIYRGTSSCCLPHGVGAPGPVRMVLSFHKILTTFQRQLTKAKVMQQKQVQKREL